MKVAVFTIVRNEPFFLQIWMKHYRRYFSDDDIYILDNETSDGSTDNYKNVQVIKSGHSFKVSWLKNTVQEFQRTLLRKYDYVLFSESDEIVFPINANSFEGFILSTGEKQTYRCSGWEIVQIDDPDIDRNKPLVSQRKKCYKSNMYSKSLLTKEPLFYSIGFHTSSHKGKIDEELILLHLHKIDVKLSLERNKHRLNSAVDPVTLKSRQGWQCWTLNEQEMKKYFAQKYEPLTGYIDIPDNFKII